MNLIRFYLISVSIISTLGSAFILFGSLIVEFPLHMAIFIGNIVILVILTPPSIISAHTVRKRISTLSNDPTTKNYAKIKNATSVRVNSRKKKRKRETYCFLFFSLRNCKDLLLHPPLQFHHSLSFG